MNIFCVCLAIDIYFTCSLLSYYILHDLVIVLIEKCGEIMFSTPSIQCLSFWFYLSPGPAAADHDHLGDSAAVSSTRTISHSCTTTFSRTTSAARWWFTFSARFSDCRVRTFRRRAMWRRAPRTMRRRPPAISSPWLVWNSCFSKHASDSFISNLRIELLQHAHFPCRIF